VVSGSGETGAVSEPNAVLTVVEMGGSEDCSTTPDVFGIMTLCPPGLDAIFAEPVEIHVREPYSRFCYPYNI